jgi:FkbM family methyltransferase
MKLIYKIVNSAAFRLKSWADRMTTDKEISKYSDCFTTIKTINKFFKTTRLCDIGAHMGDWSFVMHRLNPQLESVVMFEPQAKLISHLHAPRLDGLTKKVYQCALSNEEDQQILKGGTASASLFEASNNQNHFFPGSTNQESELVEVKVLDDVYKADGLEYPDLIKIDVQGYELNVLKGGKNVLAHARYLVIELSLRDFYQGQPPLWELWRFLDEEQYVMVDHGYELRSPTSPFELLQFDAVFMNKRFEQS